MERVGNSHMNFPPPISNWPQSNGSHSNNSNSDGGSFMLPPDALAYLQGPESSAQSMLGGTPYQNGGYAAPSAVATAGQVDAGMYATTEAQSSGFSSYFGPGIDMAASLPLDQHLNLRDGSNPSNLDINMNQNLGQNLGQQMALSSSQQASMANYQEAQYSNPRELRASTMPVMLPPAPKQASAKRSCCAPPEPSREPSNSPRHTPASSITSFTSNAGTANSASCCSSPPMSSSSSSQHTLTKPTSATEEIEVLSLSNISLAPVDAKGAKSVNGHGLNGQFSSPQISSAQHGPGSANGSTAMHHALSLEQQMHYSNFAQQGVSQGPPAWYKYQGDFGTISAPLQPSHWRAGLTVSTLPNSPFSGEMQLGNTPVASSFPALDDLMDGDSHLCTCGDDCECVGCVAHPYNNATRNTIQSAWTTMMDDATSNSSHSTTRAARTGSVSAVASGGTAMATAASQQGPSADEMSPAQVPTPSDTSGASEDQISLPAGDFLFVSYSVTGCSGEGLTCLCGDDCECIGCTIHNNAPA